MKSGKIINLVKAEYKLKRDNAEAVADDNLSIALKDPEFSALTKEMQRINFDIAFARAKNQNVDNLLKEYNALLLKRKSILKRLKMSDVDFVAKRECEKCNDSGNLNGQFCDCFKKRYYEVLLDYLSIGQIPKHTFDDANFSIVANPAQKKTLENNYKTFKKYTEKYPSVKYKNALVMGGTGVGKSFLMCAVANALKEKGLSVIYISAIQLDKLMLLYHTSDTGSRDIYLDDIIDCDFLIIDDLGSEQKIKNVTDEYLLRIFDERERHDKPIFVTTNLNSEELKKSYNERVFSRMTNIKRTIITSIDGNDLRLI